MASTTRGSQRVEAQQVTPLDAYAEVLGHLIDGGEARELSDR
jgi:hypothetical protein